MTPHTAAAPSDRLAPAHAFGLLAILFGCLAPGAWFMFTMGYFRRLFEYLLGSADKFPGLTGLVLNNPLPLAVLALGILIAGALILFGLPRRRITPPLAFTFTAAVLFSLLPVIGISLPLGQITYGMSAP